MKVLTTVPLDLYRALEIRCDPSDPEFKLLKSGVIAEERSCVVIRCDAEDSGKLIRWAEKCVPGTASSINMVPEMPISVKLRDHPGLNFLGRPTWPPVWVHTRTEPTKKVIGEVGILPVPLCTPTGRRGFF